MNAEPAAEVDAAKTIITTFTRQEWTHSWAVIHSHALLAVKVPRIPVTAPPAEAEAGRMTRSEV